MAAPRPTTQPVRPQGSDPAEEQLRRGHDAFYRLIQDNPFGVYLVDADFKLREISRGSQKVFEHVRPLIGRDFAEILRAIWVEPFASEAIARFRHTLETGEPFSSPRTVERRQDIAEVEAYDWRIERITLPDGRFGVVCYFYDLSERQRWEAALAASEARYRTLFDSIDEGFCIVEVLLDNAGRPVDYRWLATNPAFERHTGLVNAVGRTARELVPGLEALWVEAYGRVALTGRAERFEQGSEAMGRWFDVYTFRVDSPDDRHVAILFTDVTERRRAAEALRESEAHARRIIDNTLAFVGVMAPDGTLTEANATALRAGGLRREDVVGRKFWDCYWWSYDASVKDRLRDAVARAARGEVVRYDVTIRMADDARARIDFMLSPVTDADGRVTHLIPSGIDITDRTRADEAVRRAKEEAERASDAKSEFLATLSHELRTPLTPVLLTVSLMETHPDLPAELREDVATIRRNVELESRLISDLLDLTRIAKGKMQLEERDVDLHLVVRSAVDICQRAASAKVNVELAAARHAVRGDATRLQQVFWNLINNAIKFTPQDGTVSVRTSDAPGGKVRVEVADTGAGIDPAVLPRLFNAFEQGEFRAARQQAGLGLGLAISKKLTEAHGGTISAASKGPGKGATFVVELPAVEQVEAAPPQHPAAVEQAGGRALDILLVEDHEPSLRVLEKLLRRLGHRVTGVTSVASAVAAAGRHDFDVIISDLGLPDGSGLDVMRQLRHHYAGRAIALTGYGMESDVAASRDAGFAHHLTKPVDFTALSATIRALMAATP